MYDDLKYEKIININLSLKVKKKDNSVEPTQKNEPH